MWKQESNWKRQKLSASASESKSKSSSASAPEKRIIYELAVSVEEIVPVTVRGVTCYAVLETSDPKLARSESNVYLIYKIDAPEHPISKLQPIKVTNFKTRYDENPASMIIFSAGTKIYFCGGYTSRDPTHIKMRLYEYLTDAYIFDTLDSSLTPISAMKFPKPVPQVFGPLKNKVYIFSQGAYRRSSEYPPSFEVLDTLTNTWRRLALPQSRDPFDSPSVCTALCGYDILVFNPDTSVLYVFSTTSEEWREVDCNPSPFPSRSRAKYLFETQDRYFVLASSYAFQGGAYTHPPRVFSCPKPSAGRFELQGKTVLDECLGEVQGLMPEMLSDVDSLVFFSPLCLPDTMKNNSKNTCIVVICDTRAGNCIGHSFDIKVCSLTLKEEKEVKAETILQYKLCCEPQVMAGHFFLA